MVYPISRSMNGSLSEGATDGKYKKVINNRDGVVEGLTQDTRTDLNDNWFGIHETPDKRRPDGVERVTPNYRPTRIASGDVEP